MDRAGDAPGSVGDVWEDRDMARKKHKKATQSYKPSKEVAAFVAERNRVFCTANEAEFKAYCRKYNIPIPDDPIVFWAGFHKARTSWPDCPLPLRLVSLQWLMRHDMKAGE